MRGSCNLKKIIYLALAILLVLTVVQHNTVMAAVKEPPELKKWTREGTYNARETQDLTVRIVYYANEYVEALINSEAEKNLWTQDEVENYKYSLLKALNLEDSIAFNIFFDVTGSPIYAQPLDKHLTLRIGRKSYSPSDYDKRLNFKIQGKRDGMVFFPRHDPDTGKDVLEGAKDIRLIMDGRISPAIGKSGDAMWIWDITKDKPSIDDGKAKDRLELDRLIRRIEKLNENRRTLQSQLDEIDSELAEINARADELQSR